VAIQGVLVSLGLKDASDTYVAGVGAVEAKARQADTTTNPPTGTGPTTTTPGTEQRVSDARDDFAEDTVNDETKVKSARLIGLLGGMTLIAGTAYTLVWVTRTGLLTRFMTTIGMVFIAALLLLPGLGPIGMVLWFAVLGLMLAGWWVRPLPPAWAAGEAVPWPRPGEDLGAAPGDGPPATSGTVEGSGREVAERPLPEDDVTAERPPGETQGQRRKKRKRRG